MILAAVVDILKALLDRDNVTRIPSLYPSFRFDYLMRVNMDSAKFLHGSSNEGCFGEEQQVRVQKKLCSRCACSKVTRVFRKQDVTTNEAKTILKLFIYLL